MYICPKCKNEILEGDAFCAKCGVRFVTKNEENAATENAVTENEKSTVPPETPAVNTPPVENAPAVNTPPMANAPAGPAMPMGNFPQNGVPHNVPVTAPYRPGNVPIPPRPYNNVGQNKKPQSKSSGWTGFHTAVVVIVALIVVISTGIVVYLTADGNNDEKKGFGDNGIVVNPGTDYNYQGIPGTDYNYQGIPGGDGSNVGVNINPNSSNYDYSYDYNYNYDYGYTDADEYVLYGSDSRYYSKSELIGMTKSELRLARNEFYARRGRIFAAGDLYDYFSTKSWYRGTIPADEFDDSIFNEYEKANLELIVEYEKELGYR